MKEDKHLGCKEIWNIVTAEPLLEHWNSISQTLKWLSKQVFQKFGQPKQDNEQTNINKNCKTLASGLTASHTNKEPKKFKKKWNSHEEAYTDFLASRWKHAETSGPYC